LTLRMRGRTMRRRRVRRRRAPSYTQPRIRDEMKTHDTNILNSALNSANVITNTHMLNIIPQGNSAISRIGKRVVLKAIQMRGRVRVQSATNINDKVCVLLVYVRSVNSVVSAGTAVPIPSDVLTAGNSQSLTNRNYASKFKILRRWDYIMSGSTATPTEQSNYNFEEYVVFKKPLVTQWQSGGAIGGYDECEKGALLLMTIGDTAAGATNPNFTANCRLYFNESDGYVY